MRDGAMRDGAMRDGARVTVRRLYAEWQPSDDEVRLDAAVLRHVRVLRLTAGDRVELFNGEGHLAEAELLSDGRARVMRRWTAAHPPCRLDLLQAIAANAAVDALVRMTTELGVTAIHFADAERSPRRPKPRMDRWNAIAHEATRQCERPYFPALHHPQPLLEVAAMPSFSAAHKWIALARNAPAAADTAPPPASTSTFANASASGPRHSVVAIGPEGGFSSTEQRTLLALGYRPLTLGPHVLRVSTAAAAAVALLQR